MVSNQAFGVMCSELEKIAATYEAVIPPGVKMPVRDPDATRGQRIPKSKRKAAKTPSAIAGKRGQELLAQIRAANLARAPAPLPPASAALTGRLQSMIAAQGQGQPRVIEPGVTTEARRARFTGTPPGGVGTAVPPPVAGGTAIPPSAPAASTMAHHIAPPSPASVTGTGAARAGMMQELHARAQAAPPLTQQHLTARQTHNVPIGQSAPPPTGRPATLPAGDATTFGPRQAPAPQTAPTPQVGPRVPPSVRGGAPNLQVIEGGAGTPSTKPDLKVIEGGGTRPGTKPPPGAIERKLKARLAEKVQTPESVSGRSRAPVYEMGSKSTRRAAGAAAGATERGAAETAGKGIAAMGRGGKLALLGAGALGLGALGGYLMKRKDGRVIVVR